MSFNMQHLYVVEAQHFMMVPTSVLHRFRWTDKMKRTWPDVSEWVSLFMRFSSGRVFIRTCFHQDVFQSRTLCWLPAVCQERDEARRKVQGGESFQTHPRYTHTHTPHTLPMITKEPHIPVQCTPAAPGSSILIEYYKKIKDEPQKTCVPSQIKSTEVNTAIQG